MASKNVLTQFHSTLLLGDHNCEVKKKILEIYKNMSIFKWLVDILGTPKDNCYLRRILYQAYKKIIQFFEEIKHFLNVVEGKSAMLNVRMTLKMLALEFQNTQEVTWCQFRKYACFIDYISESAKMLIKNISIESILPTPIYEHPW